MDKDSLTVRVLAALGIAIVVAFGVWFMWNLLFGSTTTCTQLGGC